MQMKSPSIHSLNVEKEDDVKEAMSDCELRLNKQLLEKVIEGALSGAV